MSLTVDVGGIQVFKWDLLAGSSYKSAGIITGGNIGPKSATTRTKGIGGKESFRHGTIQPRISLKVGATLDTKALWANAFRSAGVLPFLKAQGGSPQKSWDYESIQIGSATWMAELSEQDKAVECDFELFGMSATSIAQPAAVAETSECFTANDLVLTVGGSDFGCYRANAKVDYTIKYGNTFSTKASGSKRLPTFMVSGHETHEIDIVTTMPVTSFDVLADAPATNIGLVATFGGPGSWVFTYTNLTFDMDAGTQEFVIDENVVGYQYKLIGKPGCCVMT